MVFTGVIVRKFRILSPMGLDATADALLFVLGYAFVFHGKISFPI